MGAWNELHSPDHDEPEQVDAMTFLGEGGEKIES